MRVSKPPLIAVGGAAYDQVGRVKLGAEVGEEGGGEVGGRRRRRSVSAAPLTLPSPP